MGGDGGHVAQHDGERLLAEGLARAPQAHVAAAQPRLHPLGEVVDAGEELSARPERLPVLMRVHGDDGGDEAVGGPEVAALARPLQRLARLGLSAAAAVAGEGVGAHRVGSIHLVADRAAGRRVEDDVDEHDAPVVDDLGGIFAGIALGARQGFVAEPPLLDVIEARKGDTQQSMPWRDHGLTAHRGNEQLLCPVAPMSTP